MTVLPTPSLFCFVFIFRLQKNLCSFFRQKTDTNDPETYIRPLPSLFTQLFKELSHLF